MTEQKNVKDNHDSALEDEDVRAPGLFDREGTDPEGAVGDSYIRGLFEAILFLNNEPVPVSFFARNFSIEPKHAKIILDSIIDEFEDREGGIKLVEVSNGYQFVTDPGYADQIRRAMGFKKHEKLTKGMLETLSIIAYKQPIVLADIDELRGVSSRMMVANLMKRNLVKPWGGWTFPAALWPTAPPGSS